MDWKTSVEDQLAAIRDVLVGVDKPDTNRFLKMIGEAKKIFVVGRGRTGYIVGTFAMRLMHLGLDVHVVGDCTTPRIREKDLLVACSGSGRTRMVIQMAHIARKAGAKIVFITYNPSAPRPDEGDLTIRLPANIDRDQLRSSPQDAIHPLGSLYEESLLVYMDLVVSAYMDHYGVSEQAMAKRHTNLE